MTILVLAEHSGGALGAATRNAVTAARAIGTDIVVLVAGHGVEQIAQRASRIDGVAKVLVADAPHYAHQLPENLAALVATLAPDCTHLLAAATSHGKNVLPRVAALLDTDQISDIIAVLSADTFKRPIYAGNAIATVQSSARVKVLTVRTSAFMPAGIGAGTAPIQAVDVQPDTGLASFVSATVTSSDRPDLNSAQIVVSGGRGMQSAERFALLDPLADKLGAAVGASRAAVDAGFAPNDLQVGQTGKIVAPQLYIAVGISGAIQHLAGMQDSKIIVAINKDPDAPIFQVADYGLVADLFDAIPQLERAL
ncbi:electron transfer flavoprotein subunit alpha/FixB family protein [Burkholderia multivorans]|uniref:Electron transfer flavoprotein subunit alpha n=1 Tax=Burkholderia multivorans TaxID=87883 RepID=A0AB37AWP2_9BURK|nr:FAD-binding protein [Burkholderia multivorans]PRE50442.1 electron transfer flavoprotein subunit alpha [Burkholderia multivorans]PRE50738.1 electron transfer flavoprotein subunit alpha [Burkholderia multivorans]